jgi:thymidylate kinase
MSAAQALPGARRRGFTVALIGCDGAGKTTVARALERDAALPVRYLYMGVAPESSNRQLPTTRLAHAAKRDRTGRRRGGRTRAALRLVNRLAEEWYRQLIAEGYRARGAIVVFDRHFLADYHAFDVAGEARPLSRRIHGWMLARAYPRPDLVVFLDAPPEVLHARKGEGTLHSLTRRRADYRGLAEARAVGGEFAIVSATQPLGAVVDEVRSLIRDFAARR